jgi:PAS domain S-box-containing protein
MTNDKAPNGHPSLKELEESGVPFVLSDRHGNIIRVNKEFTEVYGWQRDAIEGKPLGFILPEAFKMSHQLSFSRYNPKKDSDVVGHPLRLKTHCADGTDIVSEHFILVEKTDESWICGATLRPLPEGTETDA